MVGGKPTASFDGKLVILDGQDACIDPGYDHAGCAVVPSRVYHLFRAQDRQHLKTLTYPADFRGPIRFLDSSHYLMLGSSLRVFDAGAFANLERLDLGGREFRAAAFAPDGRRVYIAYGQRDDRERGPGGILVLKVQQAECEGPQAGLVNSYKGDGTFDDSAGAESLISNGGVRFSEGKVGQAFYFDGSGSASASSLGHLSSLGIGMHDASLTLYVKLAQAVGEETLLQWSGDDRHAGLRLLRSAQHFVFQPWRGGTPLRSKSVVAPNVWYHIAVTKTDQTITLYVNGTAEDQQPAPPPFNELSRPLTLGGAPASFHGWLDEIDLYSRALPAKEVRDLYQLRESGSCRP
jgi:hypothetical protein